MQTASYAGATQPRLQAQRGERPPLAKKLSASQKRAVREHLRFRFGHPPTRTGSASSDGGRTETSGMATSWPRTTGPRSAEVGNRDAATTGGHDARPRRATSGSVASSVSKSEATRPSSGTGSARGSSGCQSRSLRASRVCGRSLSDRPAARSSSATSAQLVGRAVLIGRCFVRNVRFRAANALRWTSVGLANKLANEKQMPANSMFLSVSKTVSGR